MFILAVACTLLLFTEGSGWPDPNCGRSDVRRRDRFIFGGRPAKDREFPWMVSLTGVSADGPAYDCGGSIIKSDVVLTAAHCVVEGFNISASKLFAGSLNKIFVGEYYQERKIKQVIIPEDFWGDVMPDASHDIALIKLTQPFNFAASNRSIGTVCLAARPPRPGKVVTVAGWGKTSPYGFGSFYLLAITIPVMKDKNCTNFFVFPYLPKIMFCAGENGKQTYLGDSGGPAVVRSGRKSFQVGIVSFGNEENPYHSSVFTKVSSYIKWINDTLRKLE